MLQKKSFFNVICTGNTEMEFTLIVVSVRTNKRHHHHDHFLPNFDQQTTFRRQFDRRKAESFRLGCGGGNINSAKQAIGTTKFWDKLLR
jgi:hypothetical protein